MMESQILFNKIFLKIGCLFLKNIYLYIYFIIYFCNFLNI